jgi:hypothetical protein
MRRPPLSSAIVLNQIEPFAVPPSAVSSAPSMGACCMLFVRPCTGAAIPETVSSAWAATAVTRTGRELDSCDLFACHPRRVCLV